MCMRSSGHLRRILEKVERGVCVECKLDTVQLLSRLRCLPRAAREAVIRQSAPHWAKTQVARNAAARLAQRPEAGA